MSSVDVAEVISRDVEKEKEGAETSTQTISFDKQNGEKLDISLTTLKSWDFDALQYSNEELQLITPVFFSEFNLMEEFSVSADTFARFTKEISGRYRSANSYHKAEERGSASVACVIFAIA